MKTNENLDFRSCPRNDQSALYAVMPQELLDAGDVIARYFKAHQQRTTVQHLFSTVSNGKVHGRIVHESAVRGAFWVMISDGRLRMDHSLNVEFQEPAQKANIQRRR